MLCDSCKERDAVVQVVRIEAGGPRQLHLCEQCAAEKGVETPLSVPKSPLGDFLQQVVQQQALVAQADATRCSFCSATLKDFRSTGRLGCARCYAAFESSLRELLRRVHGNSRHTGNSYEPPRVGEQDRASLLGELRDRLRRAIDSEQFELAADLRDRIRVLE